MSSINMNFDLVIVKTSYKNNFSTFLLLLQGSNYYLINNIKVKSEILSFIAAKYGFTVKTKLSNYILYSYAIKDDF